MAVQRRQGKAAGNGKESKEKAADRAKKAGKAAGRAKKAGKAAGNGKENKEKAAGKAKKAGGSEMERHIAVPMKEEEAVSLHAGDYVYLTGTIYTARDAAHKRMQETLERGEALPVSLEDNIIYYMGPSPARPGRVIGSAGPTTASRMDKYTPALLDLGLRGMIGKGKRSQAVRESIIRNGAVYFAAVGGAGALLSRSITASEVIAYDDLGTEAIRRLEVKDFPVIVVMDAAGNDLYEQIKMAD